MIVEVQTFESVWDALADSPAEAEQLKLCSRLLSRLQAEVRSWNTTSAETAERLGVTRRRLNQIISGSLGEFSLGALVDLTAAAGLKIEVKLPEAA